MGKYIRLDEKNKMLEKAKNINSISIVLYIFQYGLLIWATYLVKSQWPVMLCTTQIVVIQLFYNRYALCFDVKLYLFALIVAIMVICKLVFFRANSVDYTFAISFFTIGGSGLIIAGFPFCTKKFIEYGQIVAKINFAILVLDPILDLYKGGYMKFGYAMVPTTVFLLTCMDKQLRGKHYVIDFIIMLVSAFEVFVYGARGCLVVILLIYLCYFCFMLKGHFKLKVAIVALVAVVFSFAVEILTFMKSILESRGISSYAITKYIRAFEEGLESTASGRDIIYQKAIDIMMDNPLFGSSLSSASVGSNITYYHNIFLQIGCDFGVIVLIAFCIFLVWTFVKTIKYKNIKVQFCYFSIFCIAFGRLLLSSTYWQRPEFWIFMSICISGYLWNGDKQHNEH